MSGRGWNRRWGRIGAPVGRLLRLWCEDFVGDAFVVEEQHATFSMTRCSSAIGDCCGSRGFEDVAKILAVILLFGSSFIGHVNHRMCLANEISMALTV